jgi:hypothetical protein
MTTNRFRKPASTTVLLRIARRLPRAISRSLSRLRSRCRVRSWASWYLVGAYLRNGAGGRYCLGASGHAYGQRRPTAILACRP